MKVAEAAFNPTPGERLGVDQDSYEAKGNTWIRWSTLNKQSKLSYFRQNFPEINFILSCKIADH